MPEENPRRKRSIIPTIVTVLIIAGLAAGGYYAWANFLQPAPKPEPAPPMPQQPIQTDMTYASSTMGISLTYPQGFLLQQDYAYTGVSEEKPIFGVKLSLPATMTTGTNLASDSGISVETLPRANNCTADIYLLANVKAQALMDGAIAYSIASSSETVDGETIEETVFAIPSSSPCVAVRYYLHSSDDSSATGTRPFDRAVVIAAFDKIRRSMTVQSPQPQTEE